VRSCQATAAWAIGQLRGSFVMLVALVEAVPAAIAARRVLEVANRSEQVTGALRSLGRVLRPLESREPECERLRELRARMAVGEWPPSEALERLDRKAEKLVSGLRGSVHAIVAYLFQRHVPLAHVVEEERQALAERVPGWIDVAGELQALAALSGHAHEHPDHVFPEVVDGPAFLEADGLGHPLLPATQCVRNDISLDLARSLMVVSGSNMSGKSTYLRAIGLAVVLAQAGAPVRARSCRLSPLAVATSLRIADDLLSGTSHFYAEISRLADIDAGAASGLPQLVLLDEILHGTHSADRFAGARAVVARLLEQGALGLVTTHDLALAKLADEHGERVRNVHFEDTVVDGKMTFDYTVRDGVVERGNALDLMRALGLPV
jgi:DNA mismatch repair ATPase MutS